jgi:cytochrome c oxidase assembly protein subunit 15
VCFGGFVSGMKSALNYPTWPSMNGNWIPEVLFDATLWNMDSVLFYDQSAFMSALVQVIHRYMGYFIALIIIGFSIRWFRFKEVNLHWVAYTLVGIIVVQVLLGILTLTGSKGSIPVLYGSLHQSIGILFLTFLFYINIRFKPTKEIKELDI